MKKLCLLALAIAPTLALGQAFSNSVTQNSPGNYGRPVPYPQVLVCASSDTNVPCLQRAATFTDDTLTTLCATTGSAGQLIGNPTSGPGCNNPGIGDVNGNFTIFVAAGEYMLCSYSGTWLCQPFTLGTGGGVTATQCAGAINGSMGAWLTPQSLGCDNNVTTDFHGNVKLQTLQALAPYNGLLNMDTNPNGDATFAPLGVDWEAPNVAPPTPFRMRVSNAVPSVGQVPVVSSISTNTNGPNGTHVNLGWLTPAGGAEFQTNGTDNANCVSQVCPLQNLVAGSNVTLTNTSGGNVTIAASGGTPFSQLSNPVAPTLANQNAAGARSITYLIVGCQDGPTCAYHSAATATTTIANANASPQVKLTAYGDTLYGYRCFAIYVTSDSGVRTTGKIQACAWKNFIDTGGTGDGTTAPSTNTTQAWATPLPIPGCNIAQGQVTGVDAPPCSPTANNDEFTWGDGTIEPGDANDPFWTWLNENSATATLTNGMLALQAPSRAGADNLNCLELTATLPATPYSFVTTYYPNWATGTSSHNNQTGFGFYESATGKIQVAGIQSAVGNNRWVLSSWNNSFTAATFTYLSEANFIPYQAPYVGVTNDGTHITYYTSPDGVHYQQMQQTTETSFFTTAPNHLVLCIDANTGTFSQEFDYARQVSSIP